MHSVNDATFIVTPGGVALSDDLGLLTERLRRITVDVRAIGSGAGSGVVWRQDGLVITNAHVVRGTRATVVLHDGRALDARVVARDPTRDLVALAIPAVGLVAAVPGNPRAVRVGDLVVAVGNPLGITGAAAIGIVHAVDAGPGGRGPRWICADVRLAPGNSGGPLADARGRVLGVNTMVVNGLGLAVPSNVIERFLLSGDVEPAPRAVVA